MNSRQRIQAVLNHQIPDMLPIDFGAHRSSGMGAGSYNRLKRYLGYSEETTKLYDLMQHLAFPEPMMIERFGGDVVQIMQLQPAFGFRTDRWKCEYLPCGDLSMVPYDFHPAVNEDGDYEIRNKSGKCVGKRPKGGIYYDSTNYYLEEVETIEQLKEKMYIPDISDEELDYIEVQAKELFYNSLEKYQFMSNQK